ncbi:glycosyltransferase family 2 protein [Allorhizobium taibaishanense]|uniref:Succinoglycan biosynthesis protein ExoW n=1 Tax=Allorhizobium taibaishanense TaxID=887144 RepID=A0A1Q9ABS1_9HYPH|nr:glycosyltransferase [Allorhizobium taibaishanense]MBB4010590.1 succinoglycan biosynthesis protein ExoW [Allorhizobium taibaishanense]OLP52306.1 succinoglycan biosynthesis protein exow [Allorhizobium taibaishanense]
MAKLTVIIPFYQKEAGILRRALDSVFRQTFQGFDIVVVDDESPYSIDLELEPLEPERRARVRVIKQKNGGPGGARNTGLDAIPADSAFAAFLDSDDEWTPDHLQNAYDAMTRFGADCYWASIHGGDDFYYHFGMAELKKTETAIELQDKPMVIELPEMPVVMLKNWSFLHLSCMVIGRPLFEKIRFEAELRLAAEDVLFFCDCVLAAKRVILCDAAGAERGEGINIFHSIDSSSPTFLQQQLNTWVALNTLERRFVNRPEALAYIQQYKQTARNNALWCQMGRVKRRQVPQFNVLFRWFRRDPGIVQSALALAVGKFSR